MYNLPYISYGIFAFVVIAIGLLGFKKGLRAAVLSFLLTLATVGVIVGASIGLYDYISEWFSGYIKSHFGGNSQFDFSYIADAAKPQIIAVCIAIGFLPVFGLLFGITYPLYRLFKKRDFPRLLKKTSVNTKRVKPRREMLNKVGSITATSITAISTGAVISTATSAALTNSSSFNLFNKISSYVSRGTTFGFGYDTESLHRMYDFIPLTNDQVMMNAIGKILNPNSGEILTEQEIQSLVSDGDFGKLVGILNDSDVNAILNTISSQYDSDKTNLEPIDFGDPANGGYTQLQNKYLWRPLGNEGSQTGGYSTTLQVLTDAFKTTHLGINHDVVEQILEWIRNHGIQNFEDTKAYQDFERKANAIQALRDELASKQQELGNRKADLNKINSDINATTLDLQNKVNSINMYINEYNALVNGFANDNNALTDKQTIFTTKKSIMAQPELAFTTHSGAAALTDYLNGNIDSLFTYKDLSRIDNPSSLLGASRKALNDAIADKNSKSNAYDSARATTQNAIRTMNDAKANLDSLKASLANNITNLNNATSQKTALESQLPALVSAASTAAQAAQTAETNLASASSAKTQKQTAFDSAQTALTNKQAEVKRKEDEVNLKIGEINTKQNQLNAAQTQTEKDQLNTELAALRSQQATLNTELNTLKAEASQLETAKNAASNELMTANTALSTATTARDLAQAAKQRADDAVTTKQNEISNKRNEVSSLTQEVARLTSARDVAQSQYDNSITVKNNAVQAEASAKAEFDKSVNDYNAKDSANNAVEQEAQRKFNDYKTAWLQTSASAKEVDKQQKLNRDHVQSANNDLSFIRDEPGKIKVQIAALNDLILSSKKLTWASNSYSEIKRVDISAADQSILTGVTDVQVSQDAQVTIPSKLQTIQIIDKTFAGTLDPATDYSNSIPYLESTSTPVTTYTEVVNGQNVLSKKESDVAFGTEGIIAVLNFNILNGDGAVAILKHNMENKHIEFNNNIDKYIDLLRKQLS